jgi:hypothetical protein
MLFICWPKYFILLSTVQMFCMWYRCSVTEIIQGGASDLVDSYLRKSTHANVQRFENLLEELLPLPSGELTLSVEDFLYKHDIEEIIAHVGMHVNSKP